MTKEGQMASSEWYQQQIQPPQVLECNLRIGVIPDQDHAQVLVELKDPTTGIQIGMRSEPHVSMHGLGRAIDRCVAWAIEAIGVEVEPF